MATLHCWNCGADLSKVLADGPRPISRHSNCPDCFEVLHCCRMCRWYAPGRPGDCDHDRADPPVEKESANFCDYFSPTNAYLKSEGERKDAAKSKFSALFNDPESDSADIDTDNEENEEDIDPNELAKSKLDDLFKD